MMTTPKAGAISLRFMRYQAGFHEPMLTLHRSAMQGLMLGLTREKDEADLGAIDHHYLRNGGEFLLGFLDDRLIAMGGFQRLSSDAGELRRMRIRTDLQGRGYGTCLLLELERRAFEAGIRDLSLQTAMARPHTLAFYRKHGYRETGRSFYGAVETAQFRKRLGDEP